VHQQIRTRFGKTSNPGGPGAMDADAYASGVEGGHVHADRKTLIELLEHVKSRGLSICLVGGKGISGNGEFVFSVEHEEDDTTTADLRQELADLGFRVDKNVTEPEFRWLPENVSGALLAAVQDVTGDTRRADEVLIGQLQDGQAFVHVRTVD